MKRCTDFLCYTAAAFLMVGTMDAQAVRTWVSGVGDDANPCSRTAPCKTFAGAISKTAPGGEIDALDPAGFGALTITKSITIDGGGGQVASVLVSGTPGMVIAAGASDVVTLRNLRINGFRSGGSGGTVGVEIASAGTVHIERCNIFGFAGDGISFQPSGQTFLYIVDSEVSDNSGNGLHVTSSSTSHSAVAATHSHFDGNATGVFADTNAAVTLVDSSASGNTANGFSAAPSSATSLLTLIHVLASVNAGAGVQSTGGGNVELSDSTITANPTALTASSGGKIFSYGNNVIVGPGLPTATVALK